MKSWIIHLINIYLKSSSEKNRDAYTAYFTDHITQMKMMTKEKKKNQNHGLEDLINADKKIKHNGYIAVSKIVLWSFGSQSEKKDDYVHKSLTDRRQKTSSSQNHEFS